MSSNKPTIVLAEGCFQPSEVYSKLDDALTDMDYHFIHPRWPSGTAGPEQALKSMADDAAVLQFEISRLVDEGKLVTVIMHSYGGLAGSEAVPEELSRSWRKAQIPALSGGVIHLFYFTAWVLPEGQSPLSAWGKGSDTEVHSDGLFFMTDGANRIYNDLDPAEAKLWESRMAGQSYRIVETELTREPYRYIPSTYLVCEKDQAVPLQFQEMFAGMIGASVERCQAGHSPMLSIPKELAEKIDAAISKAMSQDVSDSEHETSVVA